MGMGYNGGGCSVCRVLIRGVLRAWPTFPLGLISDWIDSLLMKEMNTFLWKPGNTTVLDVINLTFGV